MPRIKVITTVDFKPLDKMTEEIQAGLKGGPTQSAVRKGFKQMAEDYRSWAKERYVIFSRGGGTWEPLKPSTIAARRKGTGKAVTLKSSKRKRGRKKPKPRQITPGGARILIDNAILIRGVDPKLNPSKGGLQKDIPFGIRLGYGGPARHPFSRGKTIAQIAAYHHTPYKTRPAREIIVDPPDTEKELMGERMEVALKDVIDRATK